MTRTRKVLEDHKIDLKVDIIRDRSGKATGYYMFCSCRDFKWIPDKNTSEDPFLDHLTQMLEEAV